VDLSQIFFRRYLTKQLTERKLTGMRAKPLITEALICLRMAMKMEDN
jgi:hypothetical protein